MNSGFPLFRVFGTEIRIHWTWIILLAVITVTFGEGLASQPDSGLDPVSSWGTAVVIALLVLVSVIVHELGHVGMAHRNGLGGGVVVVQLLGGAYLMEIKPRTPGQELRIASAGSVASLVLMVAFGAALGVFEIVWSGNAVAPTGIQATAFIVQALALFNAFVAFVNLIPAYPLDGGRIVHAIAWARSGRQDAATRVASRVGRTVGYATLLAGLLTAGAVDLWPGLALAIAGWLLVGSSRVLDRRLMLQELMAGAHVSDAADADVSTLPPQLTLDVFAGEFLADHFGGAALVERDQQLLGIIGTSQIRRIPQRRWPTVRIEDAMVPVAAVPRAAADAELWPALETLERSGLDAMLIAAGEEISSLMTRRSVAKLVRERIEGQARLGLLTFQRRSFFGRRPPGRGPQPPAASGPDSGGADPGETQER